MPYSYTKCPLCGFVEELGDIEAPCTKCKRPANNSSENIQEWRTAWPSLLLWKYLDMIITTWKNIKSKHYENSKEFKEYYKKIPMINIKNLELNLEKLFDPANESEEMYKNMYKFISQNIGKDIPTINLITEDILVRFLTHKTKEIYEENFIVIIACTFIETLLDSFLIEILVGKGVSEEIATHVIKEMKSIPAKMRLFKRLTGQKISTALKQLAFEDFSENWRYLREDKRNEFIHGNPHTIKEDDAKRAYDIAVDAVKVFACLHNKFCVNGI